MFLIRRCLVLCDKAMYWSWLPGTLATQLLYWSKATLWPRVLSNAASNFPFESSPQFYQVLKGTKHLEPIWECHSILMSTCQVLQFLKMKHVVITSWYIFGLDMKLDCCNKPVISCKELGTLENLKVFEDPLMSTNKDLINLFCY